MKRIVLYYSKTGNNKYLSEKIAGELLCDIEEIKPIFNSLFILAICSLLKIGVGIKKFDKNMSNYDEIILCGPVWMGSVISPLLSVIKKNKRFNLDITFITCCASNDKTKDDQFGYNSVFSKLKESAGEKVKGCFALPIGLVLPDDKKEDDQAIMNTRLNDLNFNGEIIDRFSNLISILK